MAEKVCPNRDMHAMAKYQEFWMNTIRFLQVSYMFSVIYDSIYAKMADLCP